MWKRRRRRGGEKKERKRGEEEDMSLTWEEYDIPIIVESQI